MINGTRLNLWHQKLHHADRVFERLAYLLPRQSGMLLILKPVNPAGIGIP
jgi:hypothetical protein